MLASPRLAQLGCTIGVVTAIATAAAPVDAAVPLIDGFGGVVGYGTQCLSPNDDGSGPVVDLTAAFPQGLRFFTGVHTSAYVNTNGNITFSGPVSTYTPNPFPVAAQPMIAPYWGDVDIRYTGGYCQGSAGLTCAVCQPCHNPLENGVWWYLEPGRMVITWDRTGYYTCHNDLRMSFQLILTAAGCGDAGDFDVEFRYNRCEWETGDASGGSNGFGGTEAQAGFDAGDNANFVAIPGSMAPGIANTLCSSSNMGTPGIWQFQIRGGTVVCPDAGSPCDTGQLGVCAEGRTNCVGSGVECVQDVQSAPERCDALDNDCDGAIDEEDGGSLCEEGRVCVAGHCEVRCSELGCPEGKICDISGLCVDENCVGVTCDPGLRCEGGECVGACDGVICPSGLDCRAGRCIDLCAGMACDSCTACKQGVCITRCEYTPCPDGETCLPDGLCVDDDCVNLPCDPGWHCEAGICVDSCAGAVCPYEESCVEGACVTGEPEPLPDAGSGGWFPQEDGSVPTGGTGAGASSGGIGAGSDADAPGSDGGCGCRTPGSPRRAPGSLLGLAIAALVGWRRVGRASRSRSTAPRCG